jgi:hypothetical protein
MMTRVIPSQSICFEEYVQDRFCLKRAHSYRLIEAALVVENLEAKCLPLGDNQQESSPTQSMSPIGRQILPTSERQCRPLTQLNPDLQREVWQQAVKESGGKQPSGRIVKDIVQRIRERTRVPNPYRVGEVCQLIAKDDPEVRGKGGQWCIISEVHAFCCTVNTWEGEFSVRLENLKSLDYSELDYSEKDSQKMKVLCHRLQGLHSDDLEEAARCTLAYFGKLERPYLTALEEKLLAVLEAQKY